VQDFVWKLTGPRPNGNGTYGPDVSVRYEGYDQAKVKPVPPPPAGTKYVLTLTPRGTLVDGRPAKPLIFERALTGSRNDVEKISDIPVALYTASGVEVQPDGTKEAVLLYDWGRKGYFPTVEIEFEPASPTINGYTSSQITFMRQVK